VFPDAPRGVRSHGVEIPQHHEGPLVAWGGVGGSGLQAPQRKQGSAPAAKKKGVGFADSGKGVARLWVQGAIRNK